MGTTYSTTLGYGFKIPDKVLENIPDPDEEGVYDILDRWLGYQGYYPLLELVYAGFYDDEPDYIVSIKRLTNNSYDRAFIPLDPRVDYSPTLDELVEVKNLRKRLGLKKNDAELVPFAAGYVG